MAPPVAIGPLSAADQAGVRELIAEATEHDGVAPLGQTELANLSASADWLTHAVAHDKFGATTGYLQVDRSGPEALASIVVRPRFRRRGVGRLLARVAAQDASIPQVGGPAGEAGKPLRLRLTGSDPGAREFAETLHVDVADRGSEPAN